MKVARFICFIFLPFICSPLSNCQKSNNPDNDPAIPGGGRWEQISEFPGGPTRGAVSFSIGNEAYVGTGMKYGNTLTKEFWQFNPVNNSWKRKKDFPGTLRYDANAFSIGEKGYICFGFNNSDTFSDLWEYDPATDEWNQKSSFPAGGRLLPAIIVWNKNAYLVGGFSSATKNDVWEYDSETNIWTQKENFPGSARDRAVGFVIGNRIYYGTGNTASKPPFTGTQDFWEYDVQDDTWTRKADFPGVARGYACGFSMGEYGYITVGILSINPSGYPTLANDLWEYNSADNSWTKMNEFPGNKRAMAITFVIGSSGYIGLGNNQNVENLSDVWKFTK